METLISGLCRAVADKLRVEGSLLLGAPEAAREMLGKLESINTVIPSAETEEVMEEDEKLWIHELKEVAYDIEDVLGDWSIVELQMRGNNMRKDEDQVCFSCIPTPRFSIKHAEGRHEIAHTMSAINKRLDDIVERKTRFDFKKNYPRRKVIIEPEAYAVPSHFIHDLPSQEEAKSTLIQKLVCNDFRNFNVSPNHIPIVSIVGMRGIGKTTLAQLVYSDRIVRNHFSKIIWVCVPGGNFSQLKIAKTIAEALYLDVTNPADLKDVLTKIVDSIKDLTFLLVLDDVWEDSEGHWDSILKCMGGGNAQGSRILMTTQSSGLSGRMTAEFTLHIHELSEEDSWSLFSYYAFPSTTKEIRCEVEDIAQELVKKCDGLPLALEVLGKSMRRKEITRHDWQDVLSSKIWKGMFEEDAFPSLALSYDSLPSQVKSCFSYCSIFPKDTVMNKNRLIQLWMAQGCIREEAIGEECFGCLVRQSFFQVKEDQSDIDAGDIAVKMHGLIHDFALYISNGQIVIFDPSLQVNEDSAKAKPRHLVALGGEITESIFSHPLIDLQALRTIFLSTHSINNILKELCSNKSHIRALEMHHLSFAQDTLYNHDLSNAGKLVHLRYLRIESSYLTVLSKGICDLLYLQTLDLEGCLHLERLPTQIGKLTSLRHLLFSRSGKIDTLPKGIGKLIFLRTLSCFFSSSPDSEDYCNVEDLMKLNNLQGDLRLKNLNRVTQVDEAISAKLQEKKQVRRLTLEFGDGDASLQSAVLEALEPSREDVKSLNICDYRGRRCPQWIRQLTYLKEVQLKCVRMISLPELGMLYFLEKLYVDEANEVKRVGEEFFGSCEQQRVLFPKLRSLQFYNMPQWKHWEGPKEITRSHVRIMPFLRCLTLMDCGLHSLPHFLEYVDLEKLIARCRLPPVEATEVNSAKRWRIGDIILPHTLKEVEISWIESEQEAPFIQPAEASEEVQHPHVNFKLSEMDKFLQLCHSVPRWITELAYLRDIELITIKNECLPPFGLVPCLEKLSIFKAINVERVGNEFLGISNDRDEGEISRASESFPRLKVLYFSCMARWKEWEDLVHRNDLIVMPSLCHLTIYGCGQLKCLPHFFKDVPLQKLELEVSASWIGRGDMPKIQNAIAEKGCCNCSVRRREHPLYKCRTASLAALEVFPSLEILKIKSCDPCLYVRRLGKEVALISSLKELYIESMQYLEELEDPSPPQHESSCNVSTELSPNGNNNNSTAFNSMPCLRILSLQNCPELKALPSFLMRIPLESLTIHDCWGLKTWWENEAREDWRKWTSNIPRFRFTGRLDTGDGTTEEYEVAIR